MFVFDEMPLMGGLTFLSELQCWREPCQLVLRLVLPGS